MSHWFPSSSRWLHLTSLILLLSAIPQNSSAEIPEGGDQKVVHPAPYQDEIVRLSRLAMELSSYYWSNPTVFTRIYDIMEKIKTLQMSHSFLSQTAAQRQEANDRLLEWAKEKFSLDGVTVNDFQDGKGFGVYATRPLAKGDIFMKIPLNYTMRAKVFKPKAERCFGPNLYDLDQVKYNVYDSSLYNALYLISERLNPDSLFRPYLDSMPTEYGIAAYYTPQDLDMLWGSGAYEDTIWTYNEIVLQYSTLYQRLVANADRKACQRQLFRPETFTFQLYQWAVSASLTRNLLEGEVGSLLVPIWDTMNHQHRRSSAHRFKFDLNSFGKQSRINGAISGYLVTYLKYGVPHGAEISSEYKGDFLQMDEFYTGWDIISEEAPVLVELKIHPADESYFMKKKALAGMKIGIESKISVSPTLPNIPMYPSEFASLLAAATGESLATMTLASWLETWRYLKKQIQMQLYFYRYNPSQIDELLKNTSLGYISSQALRYSRAEQASLLRSLERLATMITNPESYLTGDQIDGLMTKEKQALEEWLKDSPKPPGFDDIAPFSSTVHREL